MLAPACANAAPLCLCRYPDGSSDTPMALSFVPGPIMEAAEAGLGTGAGSPRGSWQPPYVGEVTRPASDEDLAFMTVDLLSLLPVERRRVDIKEQVDISSNIVWLTWSFLHVQVQQLGALLRSRAVTSVELVRIYMERLRRCVWPALSSSRQAIAFNTLSMRTCSPRPANATCCWQVVHTC
jgi:hypothetical protein